MYSEFVSFNNKRICELEDQKKELNRTLFAFDKPYTSEENSLCMDQTKEKDMLELQFQVNGSCTKIDTDYSLKDMCKGYACDDKSFFHQPERRNTYHNYLVLRPDGKAACTKNHQYFNNWTKRTNDTPQTGPDPGSIQFADIPPFPSLKFNHCDFFP